MKRALTLLLLAATPSLAMRAYAGLGPARDNQITFRIGSATLRPRLLYTPPGTMHQQYFQNDTLVMVVNGMPHDLPTTSAEFRRRFLKAKETHRESGWFELQTPVSGCVWLIAVFSTASDRIESNGYAVSCSSRP